MKNDFFNKNGRIIIEPVRSDVENQGNDKFVINYYKLDDKFTYSLQASLSKHQFAKFPHPKDSLFDSIEEAKIAAYNYLQNYCNENKLKKAFQRLNLGVFWQLDLFDDLE